LKNLKLKKSDDKPEKSSNKLKKSVGLSFFIQNLIDKPEFFFEKLSGFPLKFQKLNLKRVLYALTRPPTDSSYIVPSTVWDTPTVSQNGSHNCYGPVIAQGSKAKSASLVSAT
jgi:hypothetical protein